MPVNTDNPVIFYGIHAGMNFMNSLWVNIERNDRKCRPLGRNSAFQKEKKEEEDGEEEAKVWEQKVSK